MKTNNEAEEEEGEENNAENFNRSISHFSQRLNLSSLSDKSQCLKSDYENIVTVSQTRCLQI